MVVLDCPDDGASAQQVAIRAFTKAIEISCTSEAAFRFWPVASANIMRSTKTSIMEGLLALIKAAAEETVTTG